MHRSTTVAAAIHRVQLALLGGTAVGRKPLLLAASALLSHADYSDVVVERSIAGDCGYPLCPHSLPSSSHGHKGHFHIALREHRVYDLKEARKFCSESCLVASAAFAASLSLERPYDLIPAKLEKILMLFEAADEEGDGNVGLELGLGLEKASQKKKLEIREKEVAGGGEVSLDEWIGPADAIEGYVPRYDRLKGPKTKAKQKTEGRTEHSRGFNVDVRTTTPANDEDLGFFCSSTKMQEVSEAISKKLEDVVLEENKKTNKTKTNRASSGAFKEGEDAESFSSIQMQEISDAIAQKLEDVVLEENKNKKKKKATKTTSKASKHKTTRKTGGSGKHAVDFTSTIIVGDTAFSGSDKQASTSQQAACESAQNHLEQLHEEFGKAVNLGKDESSEEKNRPALKSSLKSTGSRSRNHSVRWADEQETGFGNERNNAPNERNNASKTSTSSQELPEEETDNSLRRASAEACANALIEAAEAVSSGKAEVEDAVLKAGIFIIPDMPPRPHYVDDEGAEEVERFEFDRGVVKWPKKTVLLDNDMFEVEDSWHDTPPKGFSLDLSAFATMWATLFGWITSSSLAYVYGLDESSLEEVLIADGKEYPQKIVLKDGQSSEIRKALDSCVCNALPGLISHLKLPVPVSILEITLGHLLDTMSFVEALPSLRSSQWQVMVLLFLDVLSVHRLRALAPVTADRMLLQKVLNAAQVSSEEYNSMIGLFLPLGRSVQTSTRCG